MFNTFENQNVLFAEPDYLLPELITPTLLGQDFKILNKIVKHYSTFNSSVIVGPDIISASPLALDYLSRFRYFQMC